MIFQIHFAIAGRNISASGQFLQLCICQGFHIPGYDLIFCELPAALDILHSLLQMPDRSFNLLLRCQIRMT